MKFKLFGILILLFISCHNSFAQYSTYDYDLVKTTFERSFNKNIIFSYLSGTDESNVKAALLSVANSKDTSFIQPIIKLNFNKYGKFITFALGELGPSETSSKYLFAKTNSIKDSILLRDCYNALGKVGSQKYLNLLLNKTSYGVSLAFYQFIHRKINNNKSVILNNLFRTLLSCRNDSLKLNDVLFTLSRIGADSTFIPLFTALLFNNDNNIAAQSKIFTLAAFNKMQFFPPIPDLLKLALLHPDWRVRTEAVKACSHYDYSNINDLRLYLNLLFDKNPNVARQTAISLKNIVILHKFKAEINKAINNIILNNKLPHSVIGELFVSFCKLNSANAVNIFSQFKNIVEDKYLFKTISTIKLQTDFAFKLLKFKQYNLNYSNINEYFAALMSLKDSLQQSEDYAQFVIKYLNTDSPSAVGIISSAIGNNLIKHKRLTLITTINDIISRHKDDDNYLEAIPTLADIAKKISSTFYYQILDKLYTSKIFSIKDYAAKILGRTISYSSKDNMFEKLWAYSFKYKMAKIITNKGDFIILFTPGYAPLSVGNFCYLASKHFFNGIVFHRVVPNFVIQTGDKLGTGWGGPGYEIKSEFSPLPFNTSAVGMASAGRDTEGSQWFVMHSNFPHLNGRYTVLGFVISGQNVVDNIDVYDKIIQINLIK